MYLGDLEFGESWTENVHFGPKIINGRIETFASSVFEDLSMGILNFGSG